MSNTPSADLELTIHRQEQNSYAVDFRYSDDSPAEVRLGAREQARISFDFARLSELLAAGELKEYGKALTVSFFEAESLRAAFAQARAASRGGDLRIRLAIAANALELHPLCWELLNDPQTGTPLATDQTIYFSRYLSSQDWRPVRLRSRGELKALVAVSSPSDLKNYKLAQVDRESETARALEGLSLLGRESTRSNADDKNIRVLPRSSASAIFAALQETQPDVLYLVCHGYLVNGQTILVLEDEQGRVDKFSGEEFVARLKDLAERPRLVVLVSCQSGNGIAALGPCLAEVGIPAVLAMQDNLLMATSAKFMPIFFAELQKDGQIDRALAVARGLVREQPDWWVPALFMRLKSGRLWDTPGFNQESGRTYTGPRLRAVPPAPPSYFTGREEERKQIAASLLSGKSVAITALHGMGGIGKTALAQKVAEDLLNGDAFPGGVLWWSLGPQPDVFAALSAWAAYSDPQANLTQLPPEARAGFVRAGLAQLGRLCAILDDAWDEENAQTLLGALPPGTAILLTTRDADLAKALHCRIDQDLPGLPEDKCLTLLSSLLGPLEKYETAAKEIARLTEGLPLALELAAGLADTPEDLPALAAQLRQTPQLDLLNLPGPNHAKREKNLRACFALSYSRLSQVLQERFRALGIFPAPFEQSALFAVWGADDAESLKRLLRRSLLKRDESGLLHQHNLLRVYAVALLLPEAQEEQRLNQRHADTYLQEAAAANQLYEQGHDHILESLQRFDLLWPHLQAAYQRLDSRQLSDGPGADRWLSQMPGKVVYVIGLRLPPRQQIPILENALAAARRLKDTLNEANALSGLGLAYITLGEPRQAIAFYEQALAIDRQTGNKRGEGADLGNLGMAYWNLGEPRRAIEFYELDLEIVRQIGDQRGEGSVLGNLGIAYKNLGELDRAIKCHEQALVIDRQIGDKRGEAADLGSLGNAYADLGQPQRAIEYYGQALLITHEIGDKTGESSVFGSLGNLYSNLNEPDKAIAHYQEALAIIRAIGDRQSEANVCWNMGVLLEAQRQFRRAAELIRVSVDFYTAIGHPRAEELAKGLEEIQQKIRE